MRESSLISVVMPVYNAGNTIEKVLTDIINQTYKNIEIIVVDDGSSDNTMELLKLYQKIDSRINIIQSGHRGPAYARNLGLEAAKGEYIRFVDGDDMLPANSLKYLIEPFLDNEEVDLVVGNYNSDLKYNYFFGDDMPKGLISAEDFAKCFIRNIKTFYFGVLWNKLYRKDIIDKLNIRFDNDLIWCEDLIFNLDYYTGCNHMYIVNTHGGIYFYNVCEGSITKTLVEKLGDKIEEIEELRKNRAIEYFKKYDLGEICSKNWQNNLLYTRLISMTRKDKTGRKPRGYKVFKKTLQEESVILYVQSKIGGKNDSLWKSMYASLKKERYFKIYLQFNAKRCIGAVMKKVPKVGYLYFRKYWPKEL